MPDKFVSIGGTRVRKILIRRYEARPPEGIRVFLEDGSTLVDGTMTPEDLDLLMEGSAAPIEDGV